MPAGRIRTIMTDQCQWCGPSGSCRSCEEKYQQAKQEHRKKQDRKRYLENKAKYTALGLNAHGQRPKGGWKDGPTLILNEEKLSPIPDEECFEAPVRITTRELKFLI